jgi:hypothetical protein
MYLMIRNKGVADHRSLSLIGASNTRFANKDGQIGTFGSGIKLGLAVLLRHNISVVFTLGNLKMEFFIRPEIINGVIFNRVCVKYSGSKTSTEDTGFCLEWGVSDWPKPVMGFREIISNAIDASIEAGLDHTAVEFEIVEKPRAKAGHTAAFLEFTPEVEKMYGQLPVLFLHFGKPGLLKQSLIPKRNPDDAKVLVYKRGVLVSYVPGKSVNDYNLDTDLTLDESRNANEWDVRRSVAKRLRDATAEELAPIIQAVIADKDTWEGRLDPSYLAASEYDEATIRGRRSTAFAAAWSAAAGPKAVASSGLVSRASFVKEKGFDPVTVACPNWLTILESYDVPNEIKLLSRNERDGRVIDAATPDMEVSVNKVWCLFETFGLSQGKSRPGCKSFSSNVDGGSQTWGYYEFGGDDIFIHKDLVAGAFLDEVVLEELTHFLTQSTDGSKDLQSFLFKLVTQIAF